MIAMQWFMEHSSLRWRDVWWWCELLPSNCITARLEVIVGVGGRISAGEERLQLLVRGLSVHRLLIGTSKCIPTSRSDVLWHSRESILCLCIFSLLYLRFSADDYHLILATFLVVLVTCGLLQYPSCPTKSPHYISGHLIPFHQFCNAVQNSKTPRFKKKRGFQRQWCYD